MNNTKMKAKGLPAALGAAAMVLLAGADAARADEVPSQALVAEAQLRAAPKRTATTQPAVAADVGTGWNILPIPAAAFVPQEGGADWSSDAFGYRFWLSGRVAHFEAPVQLPTGAAVSYIDLYAYDDLPFESMRATLVRYLGWGTVPQCILILNCPPTTPPATSVIASVSSVDAVGYQYVYQSISPAHTINNNVVYGGGAQYVVLVAPTWFGNQPSRLRFKGVDLWWKRQISPGPATASFTDVPTSHPFFQVVEALQASGATVGCTASEFCPDAPLTRAQMAAFLARVLGLYWQY